MNNQGISLGLQAGVLLEKYGFHFSHSLGQNFLLDDALLAHLLGITPAPCDGSLNLVDDLLAK